jgi:HEAT repeat protein
MHDPRASLSFRLPTSHRALSLATATIVVALAASLTGCRMWPFRDNERTSIITPAHRAAAIREMGPRGRDADEAEQARLCEQLALQSRTEPDPIVRKAIQETMSEFHTPLANAVLLAGLNDDDRDVRVACCRLIGERNDASAIAPLSKLVAEDADIDVRLAAVDALGVMKKPSTVPGLAAALKDRDPALQYAGVQAMQKISDEKLGNDVEAWRQVADRMIGSPAAAIAAQPSGATAVK